LPEVVIIADDLSGAADCAVAFMSTGLTACVLFGDADMNVDAEIIAIDAGTRRMRAEDAARETRRIFGTIPTGTIIYKKIDSMLRGHIGVEVSAALEARRATEPRTMALMAPAFPAMGRTTVNGIQLVHGTPVGQLSTVAGDAVIYDAETEEDLRAIADKGLALGVPVIWVGSAGLARHLPIAAGLRREQREPAALPEINRPILFVVGSAARCSVEQAQALRGVLGGDTLATLDTDDVTTREDPELCAALARSLAARAKEFGALVATGGETARSVLEAMGVTGLRLIKEVEPGVPLSMSMGAVEIPVITKAGAFGDRETLLRCRRALRPNG
jgi:4-hydroxythreonine-4-phosphate dehydrogenase